MNKQEFKDQLRARQDEIKEMEQLVYEYGQSIKNLSGLLRGSMITAYRNGIVDLLDMLDQKAIAIKKAKDTTTKLLQETRS